jgi:hypothetical protein
MLRLKAIVFLFGLGFAAVVLSVPARAQILSLNCKSNVLGDLSVNIDLAASSVTEGSPLIGPFPAHISTLIIAWDVPSNWHYTLDRSTGTLHAQVINRADSYNYSCAQIASPTPKF